MTDRLTAETHAASDERREELESLRAKLETRVGQADDDIETIAMLREALIESKRETQEARAAAADLEPWLWSDDDTAQTVETMGNLMTVRITGGHLRALIKSSVEASELRRDAAIGCARDYLADLKRVKRELFMEREGLGPEDMEDDR